MKVKFKIMECNMCGHLSNKDSGTRCVRTGCRGYYNLVDIVEDKINERNNKELG